MTLLRILLSQLLIISLIFSSTSWADSEKPETNTPYKTVTIIIDEYEEEEEEEKERENACSAISIKNQDSAKWSTTEIVTAVIIGTTIVASLGMLYKYKASLHRVVSNWVKSASDRATAATLESTIAASPRQEDRTENTQSGRHTPQIIEVIRDRYNDHANGIFKMNFDVLSEDQKTIIRRSVLLHLKLGEQLDK